jgi:Spy/CpxP family protein refolding chaperone
MRKEIPMSDPSTVPSQASNPLPQHRHGRVRRVFWITILVAAAAFAGAYANSALSYGPGFGSHWHRGAMFAPFDPGRAEERADRAVRHLAIEVDATNEQQDKLRAVAKAAVRDLVPMREQAHAARVKARELLTRETVDRAELERFRTEQLALADAFSKRIAQAIGNAAEILTAEQRRKINDHFPPARGFGPPWRRW